eukprot:gene16917-20119_t
MGKTAVFDFRTIDNIATFYDQLAQKTTVPDYFGRNLDALVDILRDRVDAPLEVQFTHMSEEKKSQFSKLINLFQDLSSDELQGDLTFKIL